MNISNEADLQQAIQSRINTIYIKDEIIGNSFLVAGKIQSGCLPAIVLNRISENNTCKVSVGEGIIIPVTKEFANSILELANNLDEKGIEIDIEDVRNYKINLFYNN